MDVEMPHPASNRCAGLLSTQRKGAIEPTTEKGTKLQEVATQVIPGHIQLRKRLLYTHERKRTAEQQKSPVISFSECAIIHIAKGRTL
jgi:hypothetical protein